MALCGCLIRDGPWAVYSVLYCTAYCALCIGHRAVWSQAVRLGILFRRVITLHSRTIVTTLVYCSNHTALSIPHYTTLHCPWQAAKWKVGPRQQIIPFSAAIGALWCLVVFVAQSLNDYTAALMIIQQLRPVLFPFGTVLCTTCLLYRTPVLQLQASGFSGHTFSTFPITLFPKIFQSHYVENLV